MTVCDAPLRLILARWALLATAEPVLAAAGAPLPFGVSLDGGPHAVARYAASSTAGATIAVLGPDRAVLSCADAGWRVAGAPSASELLERTPRWIDHPALLDHRIRSGHHSWLGVAEHDEWRCTEPPQPGSPLPPVFSTAATALALGGRLGHDHEGAAAHLVRMCEFEWIDAESWRTAFAGVAPERLVDESFTRLRALGLTTWTGRGPVTDGIVGLTPREAIARAVELSRAGSGHIPDEVRVESARFRGGDWEIRLMDYRDAATSRPVTLRVPDSAPSFEFRSP